MQGRKRDNWGGKHTEALRNRVKFGKRSRCAWRCGRQGAREPRSQRGPNVVHLWWSCAAEPPEISGILQKFVKNFRNFFKICQFFQEFYKILSNFSGILQKLTKFRNFAKFCQNFPEFCKIYQNFPVILQNNAKICKILEIQLANSVDLEKR